MDTILEKSKPEASQIMLEVSTHLINTLADAIKIDATEEEVVRYILKVNQVLDEEIYADGDAGELGAGIMEALESVTLNNILENSPLEELPKDFLLPKVLDKLRDFIKQTEFDIIRGGNTSAVAVQAYSCAVIGEYSKANRLIELCFRIGIFPMTALQSAKEISKANLQSKVSQLIGDKRFEEAKALLDKGLESGLFKLGEAKLLEKIGYNLAAHLGRVSRQLGEVDLTEEIEMLIRLRLIEPLNRITLPAEIQKIYDRQVNYIKHPQQK